MYALCSDKLPVISDAHSWATVSAARAATEAPPNATTVADWWMQLEAAFGSEGSGDLRLEPLRHGIQFALKHLLHQISSEKWRIYNTPAIRVCCNFNCESFNCT
jgi:hypothetical protein